MLTLRQKKIVKILFAFFFFLFIGISASMALAQQRPLEVDYPPVFGEKPSTIKTPLPDYLRYIFNFSILIAGLIAFGSFIYGGFRYVSSVGNPTALSDARERIFASILGMVILLSSYLIL